MIKTIKDIKTVDVHILTWFDRINGNSYFAGKLTLNYSSDSQVTLLVPFQYGYGNHNEYIISEILFDYLKGIQEKLLPIKKISPTMRIFNASTITINRLCRENNICLRYTKTENKKRDLKALEKSFIDYENELNEEARELAEHEAQ